MVAPRLTTRMTCSQGPFKILICVTAILIVFSSNCGATTTETTDSTDDVSTVLTTEPVSFTSTPLEQETTTTAVENKTPFTIHVKPLEEDEKGRVSFETIPAQLSNYVYDVREGDLQDIGAEESSNLNNIYIHFDSHKYKPGKEVEVTSFVADSETALKMEVEEAVADVKNRSGGADMISAFFVAPEDEVYDNKIDRKKAEERGDVARPERYSGEENTTPVPQVKNSLSDEILAPLQAAVSLSHEESHQPEIEKQMIKEMPVYKTYIEIQKSIPYELKEEPPKEEPKPPQTIPQNSVVPQIMLAYQIPQYRTPLYYRYPVYYIPQSYIGNYIMRHSHENTGVPYFYRSRPVQPQQYYYLKYPTAQNPLLPQTAVPNALQYPLQYTPQYTSHSVDTAPDPVIPGAYQDSLYQEGGYQDEDQNTLHSEPAVQIVKADQSPPANQISQGEQRSVPFRPSQHVFSSVYPPYTYRVPLVMKGRGLHARSVRSKQLCIEYGGFKPPMVPSVQIDETELPQQAEEKSAVEEKTES